MLVRGSTHGVRWRWNLSSRPPRPCPAASGLPVSIVGVGIISVAYGWNTRGGRGSNIAITSKTGRSEKKRKVLRRMDDMTYGNRERQ